MEVFLAVLVLFVLTVTTGFPTTQQDDETESPSTTNIYENDPSFAGDLSHLISLNLLKWNKDIDSNQVHSPLGVATLLAILAEGSSDQGYTEFVNVLGYPKERLHLRDSFGRLLSAYSSNNPNLKPYFKTWFYIYKNQTARTEFRDILKRNYFVEVKDIDRYDQYETNSENLDLLDSTLETTTKANSKDIIDFDSIKKLKSVVNSDNQEVDDYSNVNDNYGSELIDKLASKFDGNVDDRQYVEVPIILREDQQKKNSSQNLTIKDARTSKPENVTEARYRKEVDLYENEIIRDEEKIDVLRKNYTLGTKDVQKSNEPQRVSLTLGKSENIFGAADVLEALRSHLRLVRSRTLFRKNDIASALNANSITGRNAGAKTKMLLFNGMYFSGSWVYPFKKLNSNSNEEAIFYMTANDKIKVAMLESRGRYLIANLEHLNTKVISIPYRNQRFSLIVLIPNDIEGLRLLLMNIQPNDFKLMIDRLEEKEIVVYIPKFKVEETSRYDGMLKHLKLQTLFSNENADLSLMTSDQDVRVDELVQFVNVRVDEGGSSENSLSASNVEGRIFNTSTKTISNVNKMMTNDKEEVLRVNRPFAYFIYDQYENFVIISGKISVPEFKEDELEPEANLES